MAPIDGVEHLRGALDYHLARHNVLASNLAHIDTPGYTPADLARGGFESKLHVELASTEAGHLAGPSRTAQGFQVISDPASAAGGDANGVDLDKEAVKIASNQMRYDMLAQLASSELQSLAWAAEDGKGG